MHDHSGPFGQDKLLSYTRYLLDTSSSTPDLADSESRFVIYEYETNAGKMSRRYSFDTESDRQQDVYLGYYQGKVNVILTLEVDWPDDPKDNNWVVVGNVNERFAHDIYGQLIGTNLCNNYAVCKGRNRIFDYVDGVMLTEREVDEELNEFYPTDMVTRFISKYTYGPLGPIARKGVRVDVDPDYEMCTYNLCGDAMGNTVGVVDADSGAGQTQTFDAFGNLQGAYALTACASDPSARMAAGNLQWRGGEGSRTPQLSRDRYEDYDGTDPDPAVQVDEAFTRASCGLVYMQARFYDPATGRFTQKDPVPYGMETIINREGQSPILPLRPTRDLLYLDSLPGAPDCHGTQSSSDEHFQLADESIRAQRPLRQQATTRVLHRVRAYGALQFLLPPIGTPLPEPRRQGQQRRRASPSVPRFTARDGGATAKAETHRQDGGATFAHSH